MVLFRWLKFVVSLSRWWLHKSVNIFTPNLGEMCFICFIFTLTWEMIRFDWYFVWMGGNHHLAINLQRIWEIFSSKTQTLEDGRIDFPPPPKNSVSHDGSMGWTVYLPIHLVDFFWFLYVNIPFVPWISYGFFAGLNSREGFCWGPIDWKIRLVSPNPSSAPRP